MVTVRRLVAVPLGETVRVVGFSTTLTPVGAPAMASLILPPNPPMLDARILLVPFDPAVRIRPLGCEERRKVGVPVTVTETGTDCWNAPLLLVTVTL